MRITEAQLAILEMLTWHVRAATDGQIQQVLNDQSMAGHASDILRRLANNGWLFRRKINVAVPVLSKPLCSWSPNQSKPHFASLAWQLFVRHTDNGQRTSLAYSSSTDDMGTSSHQQCHNRLSLGAEFSPSNRIHGLDHKERQVFSANKTPTPNSPPHESLARRGRLPHMVNWATPKAAHLMAGASGWGRQPLQIEHDLGTTAMYVSSHPYQSNVIWYGEDIVRRRFSDVNKKVPDVLLVDRNDKIQKVMEYGGQYSRKRLEDFHRHWRHHAWEIW